MLGSILYKLDNEVLLAWYKKGLPMQLRIPGRQSRTTALQSIPTQEGGTLKEDQPKVTGLVAHSDETLPNEGREIQSTRASRAWTRTLPSMVVLAVILIFVFQNLGTTKVTFLTFSGTFPLALALFVAASLGVLLMLALGSIRMVQLRKRIRHMESFKSDKN